MTAYYRTFFATFWVAVAVAACGCNSRGDKVDSSFDTSVAIPAYKGEGPRVLFDDAHHNAHRPGKSYRPFVKLVESDGYRVSAGKRSITAGELEPFDVYIVAAAQGDNDTNDDPAFTDAECDAIRDWVNGGGSLLLIVDHHPFGRAAASLAQRFGIRTGEGVVEDSLHFDAGFETSHIVFSRENGGLVSHPITDGRNASEYLDRVLVFTGDAVFADPNAVTFLALSSSTVSRAATAKARKEGSDVIVDVSYGDATPVRGGAMGLALELGQGRVVVLGDAAMLSARLRRDDQRPIGMNTSGYDNRRLALNIMHWLTDAP